MKKLLTTLVLFICSFICIGQCTDTVYIDKQIDVDSIQDGNCYLIEGFKIKGLMSLIYHCQEFKMSKEKLVDDLHQRLNIIDEDKMSRKELRKFIKTLREIE